MNNIMYELFGKRNQQSMRRRIFDFCLMVIILLNVVAVILESIVEIYDAFKNVFYIFELFSIGIFSVEYILRVYTADSIYPVQNRFKSSLKYIFSAMGLIDLLAILPFYLPFLIKIDLRFLRILRIIRFLRILKISRYNKSLNLIWSVVKEKRTELAVTCFLSFLFLLIASFFMYYIEGPMQPQKFSNVITSFWWAVATLTTVGYGDVYPITNLGKFVGGIIALLGIGLIALPTGMIGAGFVEKIGEGKKCAKICPHCGKKIE